MTEFDYREEFSDGKPVFRPVADVIIHANELKVEVAMYIDSGADITLIPFRFGKALGFRQHEAETIKHMHGITGSIPYLSRKAKLQLGNEIFEAEIARSLIEEVPPLLGRQDVFDRYEVVFKQRNKKIFFKEEISM